MTLIESMITVCVCLIFCCIGFIGFLFFKIKTLEHILKETLNSLGKLSNVSAQIADAFKKFPTPEQLAKEVLKVKLPLNEAPPEVLAQMKNEIDAMNNNNGSDKKNNYFG